MTKTLYTKPTNTAEMKESATSLKEAPGFEIASEIGIRIGMEGKSKCVADSDRA